MFTYQLSMLVCWRFQDGGLGLQRNLCRPIPLVIVVCLLVGAADVLLLCPSNCLHVNWPTPGVHRQVVRVFPAVSARAGTLAVPVHVDGSTRIFVCDTENRLSAVTHGDLDADPAWDSSATRIAYVSLDAPNSMSLKIADLRRNTHRVLVRRSVVAQPQWTHDDRTIVFLQRVPGRPTTICSIDVGTARIRQVATTSVTRPQGFALLDSSTLVYADGRSVWRTSLKGERPPERLPSPVRHPVVIVPSPDARHIFVADRVKLGDKIGFLFDLTTGETTTITRAFIRSAFWSPSGHRLAIANEETTETFELNSSSCRSSELVERDSTIVGLGVCWRTESRMIVIRPTVSQPLRLEEVDLAARTSERLYPTSCQR